MKQLKKAGISLLMALLMLTTFLPARAAGSTDAPLSESAPSTAAVETVEGAAQSKEEAPGTNVLLNAVILLAVVGVVYISIREIHRDNKRPVSHG